MVLAQELIRRKQVGMQLSDQELQSFFGGFLEGRVADYQIAAMLMAIFFQGLNDDEIVGLTRIMAQSGGIFGWPQYEPGLLVDKHSTGGVGDKVSIVLLPLCLLEGLKVPMIVGRGLGHTGGTLDKLESIPGMRLFLSQVELARQMDELGGFIIGQTKEIAPLDRRLYALRDVTSTVASIPLIVASILSKKLAEGITGLVLDVKFGSGAFMEGKHEALALAEKLGAIGEASGLKMRTVLSSMDQPLGDYAGNALEIHECLEVLQGKGPADTRDLTLVLASQMVHLAFPERPLPSIHAKLEEHLDSGRAFESFARFVSAQGGDARSLEKKDYYIQTNCTKDVLAPSGALYVEKVDVRKLGLAVVALGGGRQKAEEGVDHRVGIGHFKKPGDLLSPNDRLAVIYGIAGQEDKMQEAARLVQEAYVFSAEKIAKNDLVWQIVGK